MIYLSFYGDTGMVDVGTPFLDDKDWKQTFLNYAAPRKCINLLEKRLDYRAARARMVVHSRHVLKSPLAAGSLRGLDAQDRRRGRRIGRLLGAGRAHRESSGGVNVELVFTISACRRPLGRARPRAPCRGGG